MRSRQHRHRGRRSAAIPTSSRNERYNCAMPAEAKSVLVIGGGPAGLRAAEVAPSRGRGVTVCDAQRSVGRKFLVAGRGGLNLTHGEPVENFPARYVDEPERWRDLLREFRAGRTARLGGGAGRRNLCRHEWTRISARAKSGRPLARLGQTFARQAASNSEPVARFVKSARGQSDGWRAEFQTPDGEHSPLAADAIVLALGGASWPETGSDGTWPAILAAHGVEITPWQPANCGWEVDWPPSCSLAPKGCR